MSSTEIRAKEATVQLTVNGQRLGSSFATIYDLSVKPDKKVEKKRFPGEKRARGDVDVMGVDFSFKTEKRDHSWKTVWKLTEDADKNGTPFPEISISVTYAYREGTGNVRTGTLHGDMILTLDDTNVPKDGYLTDSWSGFCSYFT